MNVIYLTTPGLSVRRRGDRLQVVSAERVVEDLRLFQVDRIVVVGTVHFTAPAIALLLDRGTDVAFITAYGRFRGSLLSGAARNVYLRLAQFERWRDDGFRVSFSRALLRAKFRAQQHLLQRHARNHPDRLDAAAAHHIAAFEADLDRATTLDQIRGMEGAGAAAYFRNFPSMLHGMPFPGRRSRPATDPVNALLSLGYVLLTTEIATHLEARGLDPAVGFLHGLRYGRHSLALDLVEPFRQPVIDRLTLRVFNRRQLTPADFEGGQNGVRLQAACLKRYLAWYEETVRAPSDAAGSPPWRERIAADVAAARQSILAGQPFEPYAWPG